MPSLGKCPKFVTVPWKIVFGGGGSMPTCGGGIAAKG